MTTTISQCRNKCRVTGLVAGLSVWAALSGVGTLSAGAGFFLGLLVTIMLSSLLIFFGCSGNASEIEMPPEAEARFVPGWVILVAVMALLVWIGLSGVGDLSGFAGFFFAFITMVGLTAFVIWSGRGGADEDDIGFAPVSAPTMLEDQDELSPDAANLQQIKGIGPAIERMLIDSGVTHIGQIADWDEADVEAMAEKLGQWGGRIRNDDWVGQARELVANTRSEAA